MVSNQLPNSLYRYFWEYDPRRIDIHKHADIIMARIMERGSWSAMIWLKKVYSAEQISSFLLTKGWRILPPREVNYWALLSSMPGDAKKQLVQKTFKSDSVWSKRGVCQHP